MPCSKNNCCFLAFLFVLEHELEIDVERDSSVISKWSREIMATEFEWVFVNMSAKSSTVNHYGYNQTIVVYTVSMFYRQRSLYIFYCLSFAEPSCVGCFPVQLLLLKLLLLLTFAFLLFMTYTVQIILKYYN